MTQLEYGILMGSLAEDFGDIRRGLISAPVAYWLAAEDMKARYARTALGPWWGVLSNLIFVIGMAITFGALFGQPLETYLPYLAAGMACWTFLSGCLVDSPNLLPRAAPMVQAFALPLSVQAIRCLSDKALLLLHYLAVYVGVVIYSGLKVDPVSLLMVLPAMAIYLMFGLGICLGFGVLGARFRDLAPAISSIMMILFMLTPIFWEKKGLGEATAWVANFNPLYHLIEIGRHPLLGTYAEPHSWVVSGIVAAIALIAGMAAFVALRRQIYFWI